MKSEVFSGNEFLIVSEYMFQVLGTSLQVYVLSRPFVAKRTQSVYFGAFRVMGVGEEVE